jgi:hypothetical protein
MRPHAEYLAKLARAMRRAHESAADYAMRHDDAAATANEALAILRAEFMWRFELLRSGPRKPVLIVPEPIPPGTIIPLSVERLTEALPAINYAPPGDAS